MYFSPRDLGDLQDHLAALQKDPTSKDAAEAIRAAAREQGAYQPYADAFVARGRALAESGATDDAVDSLLEAALVFEEEIEDGASSAAEAYEAVLALVPGHRRALFALGLVMHDLGRWDDLVAMYRRRMETSTDSGERTTLHLYVAEILAERLGDEDAAFNEILRAVRLSPTNIRIVTRLERLGDRTSRHDEVAVAIGDLIMHQSDPRIRAALSLRLAELNLGPLNDQQRALAYLKAALADDGGNPEILSEIEDVFRERARFDELAEVLEESAKDRRVGPHRVRLERELARIYELELDDLPRALSALTRAAKLTPDDRELLDEVMRLGLMVGDLGTVADTYEDVCDATDNALLQTYMRLKLGHIYANVLGRADDAIRVYWAILDTEPQHSETHRRLMKLHERRGPPEKLVQLLELEVDGTDNEAEAIATLERIVELCDQQLDDGERAAQARRRIAELDPTHPLARRSGPVPAFDPDSIGDSAVVTDATEAPTEFDGDYAPEAETQFAPEVAPLRSPRRVSTDDAWEDMVGGEDEVIEEEDPTVASEDADVIERSPGVVLRAPDEVKVDDAPVDEAPVEAEVEAKVEAEPAPKKRKPPPPPPRGPSSAWDPSEPMPAAQRPPPTPPPAPPPASITDDLELRPPPSMPPPPPADGLEVPDDAAAEGLRGPVAVPVETPTPATPIEGPEEDSAIDALDAVEAEVHEDSEATTADPKPEEGGIAGAELDGWESEVNEAPEPPTTEHRVPTQEIRERRRPPIAPPPPPPSDAEEAVGPSLADTIPEADVEEQGGIAAVADRLAEIQRELAEATENDDRPKMISLLEEIVETNENLEQHERAFFSVVKLAQLDPAPARVEHMIRLGRRAQGYPMLIDTAEGLMAQLEPSDRIKTHLLLAEVEAEDLDDVNRALSRFEELAKTAPDDEAVAKRHLAVLESAGRHDEVATLLVARSEATEDAETRRELVLRAANVYVSKLDQADRAAALLSSFLETAPEDEEVFTRAADLLESDGRFDELIALFETQASRVEGEELSAVRLEIARIHRDERSDLVAAEAALRRGLEERASDPKLLEALESLLGELEQWGDLVDVGLRRIEVLEDVAERNALRRRIAEIAEAQLASPDLALDLLTAALQDDPEDLLALLEIERLRRGRDDWEGAFEAVMRRAEIDPDPDGKISAYIEGARIRRDVFDDVDGASQALEAALAIVPGHDRTLEELATTFTIAGDHQAAIDVLRRLADGASGRRLSELLVRIGQTYEDRLGDLEAASAEYEAAYAADPECRDAIVALLAIAESESDFIRAYELAAEAARLARDERDAAALWGRAGLLAQERVGDDLRALEFYENALGCDPEDLATEAIVGELLLERGELERAYPHLDKAARGLSDPQRCAALHLGAARAADELKRVEDARASYQAVLELDPMSAVAIDRLGALLVETENWERIYELGALQVLHFESSLAPAERSAVYLRMAKAKDGLEDFDAAARLAKKAHQLAEREPEPLRLYAQMLERSGDTFEAAECLKRLSGLQDEASEKKETLVHAARLLGEEDGDLARAAAMLTEAQTYAPGDLSVAETLSEYRCKLGDATGAADALALVAGQREGRERADLLVRAARVLIAGGRARGTARAMLSDALDIASTHAGARADLAILLEFDGDIDELVKVQVRAADDFAEKDEAAADALEGDRVKAAVDLYLETIEVLRFRLEMPQKALAVCRKLMTLAPSTPGVREVYARLLDSVASRGGSNANAVAREAIGAWAYLLEQRPGHVEALNRLVVLRRRVGDEASARVTAEVLEALGEKTPPEGKPNGEAKQTNDLDTRVINALTAVEIPVHPDEDSTLKELFYGLGFAPLKAFGDVIPEPRPKKRDAVGAAGLGIHVSRPIGYTARVLGKETPPVFVREDAPAAVVPSFVGDEAAIIVSVQKAEKHSVEALRFLLGHCFALLRPRALSLSVVPIDVLREGLVGLAKLPDPEAHHVDPKAAKRRGKALERAIPAADRERLAGLARRWLASPDRRTLGDERAAVMRTAERFGLVVSGSVATSIEVLSSLAQGRIERDWQAPLLTYASTRQYAEMLRRLQ